MKRIMTTLAVAALVLAACGNKTQPVGSGTDSVAADTVAAAPVQPVAAAPADLWTKETVEAQVRKIYDRLGDMHKRGEVSTKQLEDEFCSGYFLSLRDRIADYDRRHATGDMYFMGDEGYHWLADVGLPLKVASIAPELLPDNKARAQVKFECDDDHKGFMVLELCMENGAWKVNNFMEPEAYGGEGYLGLMEAYARANGLPLADDHEPTEGAHTILYG